MNTIFLAQLWGPVLLAVAVGVFISRSYYVRIYRELERDVLAVLIFGMVGMLAGIAQVLYHNLWSTLPEVIISILGWGTLIKGTLFVVAPKIVDQGGDWWANKNLLSGAGVLMLVVGAYLSWFAYLA